MFRTQTSLLCLALLFTVDSGIAQSLPVADPAAVGFSEERLTRIDELIEQAIDDEEIAGAVALIARRGRIAKFDAYGMADIDDGQAMQADTLFRFASMTKPITSVAVMMLYEEGKFLLNDPVRQYLPEFADASVLVLDGDGSISSRPARRPVSIRDLLTHTSGLSYRFIFAGQPRETMAERYRDAGVSDGLTQTNGRIEALPRQLGNLPLMFDPGSEWAYGLSTDVLGRLVEVVSGSTLAEFFQQRIFEPLGMRDTAFFLSAQAAEKLASVYGNGVRGGLAELGEAPMQAGHLIYSTSFHYSGPKTYYSGGAGLISTAADYANFLQMLLNGGELDGERLLGPKTVEFMTRNQIGTLNVSPGIKFGLGFAVVEDAGLAGEMQSPGSYYWGGFFNTNFFVDPSEELFAILLTQRYPRDTMNLRGRFVTGVYQALIE